MRVSLVCVSLRSGGTERIVSRISNHFVIRHNVEIVTLTRGEQFYALDGKVVIAQPAASVQNTPKLVRVVYQLGHLYSSIRRHKPDLCLIFGEDIGGLATLTARLAGASQTWVFFRGTPARSMRGLNGILNPVLCRLAKRIMVQTRAAKETLGGLYPRRRLGVWPNPIELPETVRPMSERDSVIVNVGSFGRLKNQEGLVRIFESLTRKGQWGLEFIGEGPSRALLEQEVNKLGLSASVAFSGEVKGVAAQLNRASIFAFTSLSEGFPNALAEALAAGCACVSYDCPTGPGDLIEDAVNGFLVPLGDEPQFARRLQQLMDDKLLRERFSEAARVSMGRFEAEVIMGKLEGMSCLNSDTVWGATCDS